MYVYHDSNDLFNIHCIKISYENVWFQKISRPTSQRVLGNSKGEVVS